MFVLCCTLYCIVYVCFLPLARKNSHGQLPVVKQSINQSINQSITYTESFCTSDYFIREYHACSQISIADLEAAQASSN